MGRPKSDEPMEGVNVAVPKPLKRALRIEANLRGGDLSPLCRMLLEYGWEAYRQMGWERFERLRRQHAEELAKGE